MTNPATATWQSELIEIFGRDGVILDPAEAIVYEYDYGLDRATPQAVVFPTSATQVSALARLAARHGLPIVPRGAGTGISGGAIPWSGGIVVSLTRMNRVLAIDPDNGVALVEPGVLNLELSAALAPHGYFYAPDPSSQRASTIGGNIAENAGGPHCLAYGVTVNHVLGLEVVLPDGEILQTGGLAPDRPGYDITALMCGSEGTLGIVTKALVRILRLPADTRTLLAIFPAIDAASSAVSATIGRGIVPTALELMDAMTIRAVQAMTDCGYPPDAGAVLLVEMEGAPEVIAEEAAEVADICRAEGATEVRVADDPAARAALWYGRKSAAGAFGRIKPNYYLHDGVVPRTKLPQVLREVMAAAERHGLPVANVFHAGDGNLHPAILFDVREPGILPRVLALGEEILQACIAAGGTLSGEHGIGLEKRSYMPLLFSPADIDAMKRLKAAFDPEGRFNPGKMLPPEPDEAPHAPQPPRPNRLGPAVEF